MSQVEDSAITLASPAPSESRVGEQLKLVREAKGISLTEVSQTIKISPVILGRLEADAWGEMPGHTFARGVVRSYAKLLQIDEVPLLKALERAPLPNLPLLSVPASTDAALPVAGQAQRRDRLTMAAGVLLVALAVVAYFLFPDAWISKVSNQKQQSVAVEAVMPQASLPPAAVPHVIPQPSLPQEPLKPSVSAVAPLPTPPTVAPAPMAFTEVFLRFSASSWVEIKDKNGVMLLSGTVSAGSERRTHGAAPISIALGNAEGTTLTFRGKVIDLKPYTRQKVARFILE